MSRSTVCENVIWAMGSGLSRRGSRLLSRAHPQGAERKRLNEFTKPARHCNSDRAPGFFASPRRTSTPL